MPSGHQPRRTRGDDNDAATQPWLPGGPIPHTVTWRKPGYEPSDVPHPGNARREPSIDEHGRWLIPRDTAANAAAGSSPLETSDANPG